MAEGLFIFTNAEAINLRAIGENIKNKDSVRNQYACMSRMDF
jgi:hypothetical protein